MCRSSRLANSQQLAQINLHYKHSLDRAAHVANINYDLTILLAKGTSFGGRMKIRFDFERQGAEGLHLDFAQAEVLSVLTNGKSGATFAENRIHLPLEHLTECNEVIVDYTGTYGRQGFGLHSYIDPMGKDQYLYSQFEAPYANHAMPLFDQPSMKATLTLTVIAPSAWHVISNEATMEQSSISSARSAGHHDVADVSKFLEYEDHVTVHHFYTTKPISTYLYALCAGPYHCIVGPDLSAGDIQIAGYTTMPLPPQKIYVRNSMRDYLDADLAEEFFRATAHAIRYFASFMRTAFPYTKLDHVFCPEYNWGAMENVGCITYTEVYLNKQKPSKGFCVRRINTVIHEVAHMWFGNLITMKWWQDLWLNEAFATYMAFHCQRSFTFQDHPHADCFVFLNWRGHGAMAADVLSTTHPIAVDAEFLQDTKVAESIFDALTYGKGSNFLKTVLKYVGEEQFRTGLRKYFGKFAGRNATFADFVECVGDKTWFQRWVVHKGLSQVIGSPTRDSSGYITDYSVEQKIANPNVDDEMSLQTASFDILVIRDKGVVETVTVQMVHTEPTFNVMSMIGSEAKAVFLNSESHCYVRNETDLGSIEFILSNFDELRSSISIVNVVEIIQLLSNWVKAGKYNIVKVLEFYLDFLSGRCGDVLDSQLDSLMIDQMKEFTSPALEMAYTSKMRQEYTRRLKEKIEQKQIDSPEAQCLVSNIIRLCISTEEDARNILLDTAKNSNKMLGQVPLSRPHIRSLLKRIAERKDISESEKVDFESKLSKKDSDDVKCLKACAALRPCKKAKEEMWTFLLNPPENTSQDDYGTVAGYLFSKHQPDLCEPFVEPFFEHLEEIFARESQFISRRFMRYLCPTNFYPDKVDLIDRLEKICTKAGVEHFLKLDGIELVEKGRKRLRAMSQCVSV